MLNQMPVGSTGVVTRILGDRSLERKLISLGIKRGSQLEILHHRSKGVVVRSGGTRIAVGEGIAEKLVMAPDTTAN